MIRISSPNQSYSPKIGDAGPKSEIRPGGASKSEPNRPEKTPERGFDLSAEKGLKAPFKSSYKVYYFCLLFPAKCRVFCNNYKIKLKRCNFGRADQRNVVVDAPWKCCGEGLGAISVYIYKLDRMSQNIRDISTGQTLCVIQMYICIYIYTYIYVYIYIYIWPRPRFWLL